MWLSFDGVDFELVQKILDRRKPGGLKMHCRTTKNTAAKNDPRSDRLP